ncbi:unnamed protein product, partial [Meganyctiphanes norvegica]
MGESANILPISSEALFSANMSDNISDSSCPQNMQAHYPSTMLAVTAAMAFIIALLGTFGNLLTIVALPQIKKLRTSSTAFVMNLAFAELLFCLFILPVSGIQYIYLQYSDGNRSFLSDGACVLFTTARYTITQAELQTVMAIALTRAIAVSAPSLYSKINTLKVTGIYIICIWIYSFVIRIPVTAGVFGKYEFNRVTMECDLSNDKDSTIARRVYNYIEIVIPVPVIILLYVFIFAMNTFGNFLRFKNKTYNEIPVCDKYPVKDRFSIMKIFGHPSSNSQPSISSLLVAPPSPPPPQPS